MAYCRTKMLGYARTQRKQMAEAEVLLWSRLRRSTWHFRKQHPIGPYIANFACRAAMLVIEVDGTTHAGDAERAAGR